MSYQQSPSPQDTPSFDAFPTTPHDESTRSAPHKALQGEAPKEAPEPLVARAATAPNLPDYFPTAACSLAPQEAPNTLAYERAQRFMGNRFGHRKLKGLANLRDLGGMPAADGKAIRPGKLIRSGLLHDASKSSIAALKALPLARVIDLRTDAEMTRAPDPVSELAPAAFDHVSILSASAMGITDDEELNTLLEQFSTYHNDASKPSMEFYPSMLVSKASIEMWRYIFELLLKCEEGAVLWHCTAGKDRTGLAAFLIEIALGVPQDLVMEDYLASNNFTEPYFSHMVRTHGLYKLAPKTLEMIHVLYTVNARYLEVAVAAVLQKFGTIDAYFEKALGLNEAKIAQLRACYLA